MTAENLPEARCAYEPCQAGGVILAGAPRLECACVPWIRNGVRIVAHSYHPGCWAALQHEWATEGAA